MPVSSNKNQNKTETLHNAARMNNPTRAVLLIIAVFLLAAALIWSVNIDENDELLKICEQINGYGYNILPQDFYVLGEMQNSSISAMLKDEDLTEAAALSRAAGLPTDIETVGHIIGLMAKTDAGVVTVYLKDGEIQLAVVQTADGVLKGLGK